MSFSKKGAKGAKGVPSKSKAKVIAATPSVLAPQLRRALQGFPGGLSRWGRCQASRRLVKASLHWSEGDCKKLVLALAKLYSEDCDFSPLGKACAQAVADPKTKATPFPRPRVLSVLSLKNSACNTAKLTDLDFDRGWWTDDSFGLHYLHVWHKDGETIHRVHCRHCPRPRISARKGKLFWLVPGADGDVDLDAGPASGPSLQLEA
jgi:hypothetical protein